MQALGRHQRSLAKLLDKYCQVTADKSFQKSDWRVRFALQRLCPFCAMPLLLGSNLQDLWHVSIACNSTVQHQRFDPGRFHTLT